MKRIILFILAFIIPLYAQWSTEDVKKTILKMKECETFQDEGLVVLLDSTFVEILNSGASKKYRKEIFYINKEWLEYDEINDYKNLNNYFLNWKEKNKI